MAGTTEHPYYDLIRAVDRHEKRIDKHESRIDMLNDRQHVTDATVAGMQATLDQLVKMVGNNTSRLNGILLASLTMAGGMITGLIILLMQNGVGAK